MNNFWSIMAIILAWVLSFVEPSGWAEGIGLPDTVNMAIFILSILFFIFIPSRRPTTPAYIFLGLIITFILIPYITSESFQGASYLTSFLVVYLFSQARVSYRVVKYTAIGIGVGGLIILEIYLNGDTLSGWNDNAVSIFGLFSFFYFSIFLSLIKGTRKFVFWNIITVFYLVLLFSTDCRSGMIFSVLGVLAIIYARRVKKFINKRTYELLILNIPLIIAFIVIAIGNSDSFAELDKWSHDSNGKGVFNGRNELWEMSLELLAQTDYIGVGRFFLNFHNSCIAALTVFGVAGYVFWELYFFDILKKLRAYMADRIVYGCMVSFIMIFLQQSVELGLISTNPNLLPYLILGVGLGRIYRIKKLRELQSRQ